MRLIRKQQYAEAVHNTLFNVNVYFSLSDTQSWLWKEEPNASNSSCLYSTSYSL